MIIAFRARDANICDSTFIVSLAPGTDDAGGHVQHVA